MATGIPYLGSKISLISKSEIRYEGILYTIDTKESTVALAKVRSYGTEDRPTDRPVAPRDETYEYIIFRGADIKDIRVCQPPKPRPTLEGGLPLDPAIVQHSRGPPGAPGSGPSAPGAGSSAPGSDVGGSGKSYGPIGGPAASGSFSAAPGSQPAGGQPSTDESPVMDLLKEGQSGNSSPAPGAQSGGRPSSRTSGGDSRRGRGGFRGRGQQRGGVQQGGNFRGQPGNRGRGGFQPGRPSAKGKDTLKFDSEYDFEQANEEFKEFLQKFEKTGLEDCKESAEDLEDGEIEEAGSGDRKSPSDLQEEAQPCYDKKKSFFDTISCEAMERSKGGRGNRPDWKAEKKLNRETFGVTGNMGRRNWYGGGGYRGRGGGGFGQGGNRGGYGYNNRGGFGGYNNGYQNGGGFNGYGGGQGRFNNRGGRGWHNGPPHRGRGRGAPRGASTVES